MSLISYAWRDEGNDSGPVTGINLPPKEGEETGKCKLEIFTWGISDASYYHVYNKVLVAKSQEEVDGLDLTLAKEAKSAEIVAYRDKMDADNFEYMGETYKSTRAIETTLVACGDLKDADSIPCNAGCWDTVDLQSIPYTKREFIDFFTFWYGIPASNYSNAKFHISVMGSLSTLEEVKEYNFSTGWV